MFISLLCAALAMPMLFPKTPVGAWFKRLLVDYPARLLARMTLSKMLLLLVMAVATIAFVQAFPAELAWLAAADVATYVELVAAIGLAAASVRIRSFRPQLASIAARLSRWVMRPARTLPTHARSRSQSRRPRQPRAPHADDGDAPAWGLAFA